MTRNPATSLPFRAHGVIQATFLHAAQITLDGAQLESGHYSLVLEKATITGSLLCRQNFCAKGTVRLLAAEIGNALEMDTAHIHTDKGAALEAERIRTAGPVFLRKGFTA